MSNWRLVEGLESMILDDKVYLYPISSSKKSSNHRTEILKNISPDEEDSLVHKSIDVNSFNIKLDEYFQAYIKSSEFPDPEKYYLVMNFFEGSAGKMITQTDCRNGIFDDAFEAAFNENYVGKVMFVSENMKDYDNCMDEMIRIMSCEVGKKTRKWIPGHRYDSPTETLYYLGEFKSHRANELMSKYLGDEEMSTVHLVVNNIKGLTKISEVFNTRMFGDVTKADNTIRVLEKIPLMVDSGEKLENDIKDMDLSTKWNEMLSLVLKDKNSSIKQILDVVCYNNVETTDNSYKNISSDIIDEIKYRIDSIIEKCLLIYWDTDVPISGVLNKSVKAIKSTNSIESNINTILDCIGGDNYFEDINAYSPLYYPTLLMRLGIDIRSLIEQYIKSYSPQDLVFESLDNYVKYGDLYFTYRDMTKTDIIIDQVNSNKRQELKNYFDLLLTKEIKDLVDQAKNNPSKITRYCSVKGNGGTRFCRAVVTLNDILKNREFNLPENLTNEILKNKFRKVTIEFDLNNTIK